MITILNEQAMVRADAIDRCNSLGEKFIWHFHKVYTNPNDLSVNHWINEEMQGWLNSVKNIVLKQNNKKLRAIEISDWFLTAGSYPEDIVKEMDVDELEIYDRFCVLILLGNTVEQSFKELNIVS